MERSRFTVVDPNRRDLIETLATDSPKYKSFFTDNFELTNELLGKLVNAIYISAGLLMLINLCVLVLEDS